MSDPYGPAPIGQVEADIRNKLGAEPAQDQRWEWVKRGDYPTLAAFLQTALLGFGGLGARGAPPIMRDSIMANQLARSAPASDPGITGGAVHDAAALREMPAIREILMREPSSRYSSVGLANEVAPEAFRSTVQPVRYPDHAYQRRMNAFGRGEAANNNKSLQIDDPYSQAVIDQQWADMVRRSRQPDLSIIPGGKKD